MVPSENLAVAGAPAILPLVIGVAAGIVIVVVLLLLRRAKRTPEKPLDGLLAGQKTCDTLSTREIWEWADSNRGQLEEGMRMAVIRTTPKWMSLLGYREGRKLNATQNVVACIIDSTNSVTHGCQLFSFGTMDPKLQSLFGDLDIFFLEK